MAVHFDFVALNLRVELLQNRRVHAVGARQVLNDGAVVHEVRLVTVAPHFGHQVEGFLNVAVSRARADESVVGEGGEGLALGE